MINFGEVARSEILRVRNLSSAWTKVQVLLEGSVGTAHILFCREWAGQGRHGGDRQAWNSGPPVKWPINQRCSNGKAALLDNSLCHFFSVERKWILILFLPLCCAPSNEYDCVSPIQWVTFRCLRAIPSSQNSAFELQAWWGESESLLGSLQVSREGLQVSDGVWLVSCILKGQA